MTICNWQYTVDVIERTKPVQQLQVLLLHDQSGTALGQRVLTWITALAFNAKLSTNLTMLLGYEDGYMSIHVMSAAASY